MRYNKLKKNFLINDFFIYFFALVPVFAILVRSNESFSYISFIIFAVSVILFIYRLSFRNIRLWQYQKYFFLFCLFAFVFDSLRGEFYSHNKLVIMSFLPVIASTVIDLSPKLENRLHKLFILYIISSFVVVIIQRTTGIFWETTAEITVIDLAQQNDYRFSAYWVWISWVAQLTIFPVVTGIVLMNLTKQKKMVLAYVLAVVAFITSVLSGNRTLMIYMLLVSMILIDFRKLKTNLFTVFIVVISLFVILYSILNLFDISIERIFNERIYQSDKRLENRSEYARVENYDFFFRYGLSLFGAGNEISPELSYLMMRPGDKMLIGILEPAFTYGVISLFYYLFLLKFLSFGFKIFEESKNATFVLLILGYIVINLTTGVSYLSGMQAFFLIVYMENYYKKLVNINNVEN